MKVKNKNQNNCNSKDILEQAAESWSRLCIFHIRQKKQLGNQYQNKNYAYKTN